MPCCLINSHHHVMRELVKKLIITSWIPAQSGGVPVHVETCLESTYFCLIGLFLTLNLQASSVPALRVLVIIPLHVHCYHSYICHVGVQPSLIALPSTRVKRHSGSRVSYYTFHGKSWLTLLPMIATSCDPSNKRADWSCRSCFLCWLFMRFDWTPFDEGR